MFHKNLFYICCQLALIEPSSCILSISIQSFISCSGGCWCQILPGCGAPREGGGLVFMAYQNNFVSLFSVAKETILSRLWIPGTRIVYFNSRGDLKLKFEDQYPISLTKSGLQIGKVRCLSWLKMLLLDCQLASHEEFRG